MTTFDIVGHSLAVPLGVGDSEGAAQLLAAHFGAEPNTHAVTGAVLYSSKVKGGYANVANNLTRESATYERGVDYGVVWYGANDLFCMDATFSADAQEHLKSGFRFAISRMCAGKVFDDGDESISYSGFSKSSTLGEEKVTGTTNHVATEDGSKVIITVPPDFPGGPIAIYLGAKDGEGATWTFTIDGEEDAETLSTAYDYGIEGDPMSMFCRRFTDLAAGEHTIECVATDIEGHAWFDSWAIEAAEPPTVVVPGQYKLPEYGSGETHDPDDTDIENLEKLIREATEEFGPTIVFASLSPLDDTTNVQSDGMHLTKAGHEEAYVQFLAAVEGIEEEPPVEEEEPEEESGGGVSKLPVPATTFASESESANEFKPTSLASTEVGDLIICTIIVFATGRTWTAPGWTQVGSTASVTGGQFAVFYRLATEAGEHSYPISINQSAVSGAWVTTTVSGADPTTPMVGGETHIAVSGTEIDFPSATPTDAPGLDLLLHLAIEEDTVTTPASFTAYVSGNGIFHSFGREYTDTEPSGETTTTQSTSTPHGTARVFVLGQEAEEEPEPEEHSGSASVSGAGSIEVAGSKAAGAGATSSGVGAVTASGTKSAGSSTALSGSGEVVAAGSKLGAGACEASGSGSTEASGRKQAAGAVSISGAGDASVAGRGSGASSGEVSISGGGSVEAQGSKLARGSASTSGTGTVGASGAKGARGSAEVSGGGAVSVAGTGSESETHAGSVLISGGGSVEIGGRKGGRGAAAVSGAGGATSSSRSHRVGVASISGGGSISVEAQAEGLITGHHLALSVRPRTEVSLTVRPKTELTLTIGDDGA